MEETKDVFIVKRLKPEEAMSIQISYYRSVVRSNQRSYNLLSDEKRYQLVDMITNKSMKVSEAAAYYGLNYMTVKNIISIYRNEGRIEKKKARKKRNKRV